MVVGLTERRLERVAGLEAPADGVDVGRVVVHPAGQVVGPAVERHAHLVPLHLADARHADQEWHLECILESV